MPSRQSRLVVRVAVLMAVATAPTAATTVAERSQKIAVRHKSVSATTSPSCFSTVPLKNAGPNSFVGVTTGNNVAGGALGDSQYAGVLAGFGNVACSSYTGIVAGENNQVGAANAAFNPTATDSLIGAGTGNYIGTVYSGFIGAGDNNSIDGPDSQLVGITYGTAIVGGYRNSLQTAPASFIGAGSNNTITSIPMGPTAQALNNFIGGGDFNKIQGSDDTVVGGAQNIIGINGPDIIGPKNSFIGGGYANRIVVSGAGGVNGAGDAVISGGANNMIASATASAGYWATISGGSHNTATGVGSAIPGGVSNIAGGADSFAAGTGSYAKNDGSFVFSDDAVGARQLITSGTNQFLVRASGGYALYSNAALSAGVVLRPGSGSWSTLSDRAVKSGVRDVDGMGILAKLSAMPVSEWSYTAQGSKVRHLGPMAQDFRAAFHLGEDDKHISTVDEEGVALAAIKALQHEVADRDTQLEKMHATLAELGTKYVNLEHRLDSLIDKSGETTRTK